MYVAYHDTKVPDIYLRTPPHPQQHLWGSVQIQLDILVVRGRAEACLAEIAQHWSAVSVRNTELSRSINSTIPSILRGLGSACSASLKFERIVLSSMLRRMFFS